RANCALVALATRVEMFTSTLSVPPEGTAWLAGLKLRLVASEAGGPPCTVPLLTPSVGGGPPKSLTRGLLGAMEVSLLTPAAAVKVIVASWSWPVGPGPGQPTREKAPTLVWPGWGGGRKLTLKVEQPGLAAA